jgi:stage IV sporulation protein FB
VIATSAPTPLDLRFHWFGIPTRVHPLFWLFTFLLGPTDLTSPYAGELILIWMVCAFVSIMIHETGHVLAYRFYRCGNTRIDLEMCCGLASADRQPRGNYRRIFVALAGPGIQFLVVLLLWLSTLVEPWHITAWFPYSLFIYYMLFSINLGWALFNLLPIFPLDGGRVSREVCYLLKIERPLERSLKIGFITAIVMIFYALIVWVQPALVAWVPSWVPCPSCLFTILFMASLAYTNYQAYKMVRDYPWGHEEDDDRQPWER